MKQDDISYMRDEIRKAHVQTPYGEALPAPWLMLEEALDEVDRLKAERDGLRRVIRDDLIRHAKAIGDLYLGAKCRAALAAWETKP